MITLREYLQSLEPWQDVTFIISNADYRRTTAVRSARDWLVIQGFCDRHELVKVDVPPGNNAQGIWRNWYKMGRLKCALLREVVE